MVASISACFCCRAVEGETDFLMGMIWFVERREILRGKNRTTRTDLDLSLSLSLDYGNHIHG